MPALTSKITGNFMTSKNNGGTTPHVISTKRSLSFKSLKMVRLLAAISSL
jgi:hypothetical protein